MLLLFVATAIISLECVDAYHPYDSLKAHARGGIIGNELLRQQEEETASLRASLPTWNGPNASINYKTSFLDNFGSQSAGTYQQRYYYDTSFCASTSEGCWSPSTPVILEIGGEWTVSSSPSGAIVELCAQLGAMAVYLEHRFYGFSSDTPGDHANRTSMLSFLSVEQSIADSAAFMRYFDGGMDSGGVFGEEGEGGVKVAETVPTKSLAEAASAAAFPPLNRSWAIVGGSYAGALVTWITVKHGVDLPLAATWASSGVSRAVYNFTGFDKTIVTALGPDCTAAMQAATAAFEATPWPSTDLLALFNATGAPEGWLTRGDFAWMLADSVAMGPQYGFKDSLCSYFGVAASADTLHGSPPPLVGWEALVALSAWTRDHYGVDFSTGCYYSTLCLSNATLGAAQWNDGTTWVWQCCSEVAYWQITYPGSIRSSLLTTDYFMGQCASAFPGQKQVDTVAFNGIYGGDKPFVSTAQPVYAYQGSDDPWQTAGVERSLGYNYLEVTAVCDGCSHCKDLRATNNATDPPALTQARGAIMAQVALWITQGPTSPPSNSGSNSYGLDAFAVTSLSIGFVAVFLLVSAVVVFRERLTAGLAAACGKGEGGGYVSSAAGGGGGGGRNAGGATYIAVPSDSSASR